MLNNDYDERWEFSDYTPPDELKGGVRYIEDILDEVGREENLTKREVRDLWNHQVKYMKKLMEKGDVFAIRVPYLGTLCFNTKFFDKYIKRRPNKARYQEMIKKNEDLKNHENYTYIKNAHKAVPSVMRLARAILRRYDTEYKRRRLMYHKKCYDIIERYSNNEFKLKDE